MRILDSIHVGRCLPMVFLFHCLSSFIVAQEHSPTESDSGPSIESAVTEPLTPPAGLHVEYHRRYPHGLRLCSVVYDNDGEFSLLGGANSVKVNGNIACVASMNDNSFTFLDVSDATRPVQLSSIRDGDGLFQQLEGAWSSCSVGKIVYLLSSKEDSLTIIDASNPASPQFFSSIYNNHGEFNQLDQPSAVVVRDGTAYITSFISGSLTIVDVGDPRNPKLLSQIFDGDGEFNSMKGPWNLALDGNHVFVAASGDDSINIIDVSNPSDPSLITVLTDGVEGFGFLNRARDIEVHNGIAYVAAQDDDAVSLIDVSNPARPALISVVRDEVGDFTRLDGVVDISVSEGFMVISSHWDGSMTLVDVTNPLEPALIAAVQDGVGGFYRLAGSVDTCISGQYVYLAARSDSAITVFDTSAEDLSIKADSNLEVWGNIHADGNMAINGAKNPGNLPIIAGIDATNGNGAYLTPGGAWTNVSDAAKKESFQAVDALEVLKGVVHLPVQKWQYKGATNEGFHLGPTAQDFHDQFGLGTDEHSIATVDAAGVALVSIQGLHQLLMEKETSLQSQAAKLEELMAANEELRRRVEMLERQSAGAHANVK